MRQRENRVDFESRCWQEEIPQKAGLESSTNKDFPKDITGNETNKEEISGRERKRLQVWHRRLKKNCKD